MALPSTVHNIEVALSHVDRGVYEQLSLKAARHPSETEEYYLTRLLAYCLEFDEGISFSRGGVSDPDDPPLMIKDLTGGWMSWIEIGAPNAARLHQASKASPRVALYTHKEPRILMRGYEGQRIHKAEEVEIYAMDRDFLASLVDSLDRRIEWALSVTDSELFLDVGGASYCGAVERLSL
jgi:uncharacterized protein YaeQ